MHLAWLSNFVQVVRMRSEDLLVGENQYFLRQAIEIKYQSFQFSLNQHSGSMFKAASLDILKSLAVAQTQSTSPKEKLWAKAFH